MSVSRRGLKRKGDRAEMEVLTLLRDYLGNGLVRPRLEGDADKGDIAGLALVAVQVKSYADVTRALREGLESVAVQKVNAGKPFGAAFVRRRGGKYVVAMDPIDWLGLYREAALR